MPDLVDGRYQLLDVVASGGMASVWRARDTRLDRLVAVKRPHPAAIGDQSHVRFEREARAAAALSHPHLVTVYDSGRDEAGPFLVMELVEGTTLAGLVTRMSLDEVLSTGSALADALSSVHAAGIVHRDVKPANVLMSDRGPLLTDFGIAAGPASTSQLTQPGTVLTTASYAAPEVLGGEPATAAADVFALGAVLYELAAGRPAFFGTDRSPAPAPLEDPYLESSLRPALSLEPAERPSAAALAAALASASPTRPVFTAPGTTAVMPTRNGPHAASKAPVAGLGWPVLAAIVGILAIAGLAFALGGDDSGAPAATATTSQAPATTLASVPTAAPPSSQPTTIPPPSTSPPTVVATAPVTSTEHDPVAVARDELAAVLDDIGPAALKPKDSRDIMAGVDDAIAVADEDADEAAESLREAAKHIDDRVEDPWRSRALDAIDHIAAALGLVIDDDDADDDDD